MSYCRKEKKRMKNFTRKLVHNGKECGFASSLVGEQKIRTISISEWIEPKVAPIAVNVFPVEMKWTGEIMIKDLQP